jgi:hypothetical protein
LLEALLDQEATLADATPWNLAGFRQSDLGLDDNSMLQVEYSSGLQTRDERCCRTIAASNSLVERWPLAFESPTE